MDVLAKRYPLTASTGGGVVIGILTAFAASLAMGLIVGVVSAVFFWVVIRYLNDSAVGVSGPMSPSQTAGVLIVFALAVVIGFAVIAVLAR